MTRFVSVFPILYFLRPTASEVYFHWLNVEATMWLNARVRQNVHCLAKSQVLPGFSRIVVLWDTLVSWLRASVFQHCRKHSTESPFRQWACASSERFFLAKQWSFFPCFMLYWPTSTTLELETINVKDLVWALDLSSGTIATEFLEGNLDSEPFMSVQVACPWSVRSFAISLALL